ncbi:protein kinase domain protein [Ichthyophthirius multifiliis]|uniref:Protein kinase domain protein n=1 Tax=Ichthyophthirius multifiliis TaxID=5932 RepID=G0QRS2_ICHMU|nr:protein kinase domain protein [Ichthyophthirius multifiliis]EGR32081.1 protein kinase domain protein [Ichthyophthirius multifiliis]|eukprot:XP_004035567.1 protein kinase domain protein [Ichthyophthirius multifiliis]
MNFYLFAKFKYLFYFYNNNNFLLKNQNPFQKVPNKIIELIPSNRIIWNYNKQQLQYQLLGFQLQVGQNFYEFLAEELSLNKLKSFLSQRIFQAKFQDEYKVENQIGKGNYARVIYIYIYIHIMKLFKGVRYAVKCFEKQKLYDIDKGMVKIIYKKYKFQKINKQKLSLYNELRIMRCLTNHLNIIKLFEVFEGENTFYFVMEIVDGTTLYDEIKKHSQTPYKDNEVKEIIKLLIQGIDYCTQNNIMHRDIKPENILFSKKNNKIILKIVDFGLASFVNDDPYIFPKCGTPGFVAPEIANLVDKNSGYSAICDMFSIGIIFHILLTGEAVFLGKKFNDVLKKNKDCIIDFNKPIYENLSQDCKNLLQRLLEKDPIQRINSKQALEHPYFQTQYMKKMSIDDVSSSQLESFQIRQKNNSLFTTPLRIPYLTNDESQQQVIQDNLNSFVTRDPVMLAQNQKLDPSNAFYYTIGRSNIEYNS